MPRPSLGENKHMKTLLLLLLTAGTVSYFNSSGPADDWHTTYKTSYVYGYKPPTIKTYNYQSPYGQLSNRSRKALVQEEKKQRLVTLQQPSIISESLLPELSQLCHLYASGRAQGGLEAQGRRSLETRNRRLASCLQCVEDFLPYSIVLREQMQQQAAERCETNAQSGDCYLCDLMAVKKPRVYRKDLPSVARLPLPSDISEPKFVQLQANHWKGMPYPFADPRFDPFIPVGIDGSIAPSTLNPFKYCQRKRTFPQFNRCPNLPVPEEALPIIEPPGFTTLESKLSNRRWAKKRFPKPPEAFLTHLW